MRIGKDCLYKQRNWDESLFSINPLLNKQYLYQLHRPVTLPCCLTCLSVFLYSQDYSPHHEARPFVICPSFWEDVLVGIDVWAQNSSILVSNFLAFVMYNTVVISLNIQAYQLRHARLSILPKDSQVLHKTITNTENGVFHNVLPRLILKSFPCSNTM